MRMQGSTWPLLLGWGVPAAGGRGDWLSWFLEDGRGASRGARVVVLHTSPAHCPHPACTRHSCRCPGDSGLSSLIPWLSLIPAEGHESSNGVWSRKPDKCSTTRRCWRGPARSPGRSEAWGAFPAVHGQLRFATVEAQTLAGGEGRAGSHTPPLDCLQVSWLGITPSPCLRRGLLGCPPSGPLSRLTSWPSQVPTGGNWTKQPWA